METFNWPLRISRMDDERARDIEEGVGIRASVTIIASPLLRKLGIEPTGQERHHG